jgi:hypothetical protein
MREIYANQNTSTLAVDNYFFYNLNDELSFMPEEIHEVRWNGISGEVRYDDGRVQEITELNNIDQYISIFDTLRSEELASRPTRQRDPSIEPWSKPEPVPGVEEYDVEEWVRQWNEDNPAHPITHDEEELESPTPPTQEEISVEFRNTRNNLLLASDWTQLANSPLTDSEKLAWESYRQELRDSPETIDSSLWESMMFDENNLNWPTEPS